MIITPPHTRPIFNKDDLKKIVPLVCQILDRHPVDAIAGLGNSGIVLGAIVAFQAGIPFIAVRRNKDETIHDSHSINVYSEKKIRNYAIIDDLISSGETLRKITNAVNENLGIINPSYIVLYNTFRQRPWMSHNDKNVPCFSIYDNWYNNKPLTDLDRGLNL